MPPPPPTHSGSSVPGSKGGRPSGSLVCPAGMIGACPDSIRSTSVLAGAGTWLAIQGAATVLVAPGRQAAVVTPSYSTVRRRLSYGFSLSSSVRGCSDPADSRRNVGILLIYPLAPAAPPRRPRPVARSAYPGSSSLVSLLTEDPRATESAQLSTAAGAHCPRGR